MKKIILSTALIYSAYAFAASDNKIDLSGSWQFGYGDTPVYKDKINLPGSMLTNGKGRDVDTETKWTGSLYDMSYYYSDLYAPYREHGNIKFPFFLTPDKEYVGKAYYRKNVTVPADWKDKRVILHLERPHIETTLTVNGNTVGHQMSLSTPHEYDITEFIEPGKKNNIEVMVYNGIENVCVGQDSHSVTDQTQGNWNGIAGEMYLKATPKDAYIRNIRIYPDVKEKKADIKVLVGNKAKRIKRVSAQVVSDDGKEVFNIPKWSLNGDTVTFTVNFGDRMKTWDEFSTPLYKATVYFGDDEASTMFGMRDISVSGRDIKINGRPMYVRGTVENCCFPLTGYAPTDEESWAKVFEKCKEYGINMMRFHSYCPPEAAFAAADKEGIYLQPEGPSWPNHGVKLRSGMTIDQYLIDEGKAIIDAYGNHPSFVMFAAGNEPAGNWVPYTDMWVATMKDYDPTKIYCGASVGGGWAWDGGSEYHVKGGGRGLEWKNHMPSSDDDYMNDIRSPRNFKPTDSQPENNSPILAHEQGQWCAFPDLSETSQYTGPYKARNFEIFRDLLEKNGMKGMDRKFLMSSGKLQTLCYKYEIERNLRTPDYTGFQLLALNDYSGQGTALEGVLNVFWKEKGYVNGEEWREFCSPVVPLARFPKFVFTDTESVSVPVEIINATADNLGQTKISYSVTDPDGVEAASGILGYGDVPVGKNHQAGSVTLPIGKVVMPMKYTLTVNVGDQGHNTWEYWVYPEEAVLDVPKNVFVTDTLDATALEILDKGGNVLLTAAGKVTLGKDVVQNYMPVFWNTSWFKMRPPHTTGAYIDTTHPLFAHGFPTDDWSNLNWWELLNKAQVMNLLELPADYQSPIQPIDTWHLSRKLGMVVEANVLNGKLFMTTMDLDSNLDKRIVAKRMRNAVLDYMASEDFNPSITLQPEVITDFFTKETAPVEMYTNETPDELKPKLK
ncbi:MAG: beta-glucuronidase [Muribaculaceae bacterium]|nr:beta-glucuronidase [Muribaculaceae bacterium]